MPDIARDMREYDARTPAQRLSYAAATTYQEVDDYKSNQANSANSLNLILIKENFRSITRALFRLISNIFWNLIALFLLACVCLIIYNLMGLTFLQPYFDYLKIATSNLLLEYLK